jgi:hypothetical protein
MTDHQDKLAARIVAEMKREGYMPAVTAAPAADSLRPEVTKVAADVDKLTGEVDELKQLVKTMTTKLEERFDKQRQLIRMSFALVIAIVFGIQLSLWSVPGVNGPKSFQVPTNTRLWCEYIPHRENIVHDGVQYLWNQTTMYLHNMTRK